MDSSLGIPEPTNLWISTNKKIHLFLHVTFFSLIVWKGSCSIHVNRVVNKRFQCRRDMRDVQFTIVRLICTTNQPTSKFYFSFNFFITNREKIDEFRHYGNIKNTIKYRTEPIHKIHTLRNSLRNYLSKISHDSMDRREKRISYGSLEWKAKNALESFESVTCRKVRGGG